MVAPTGLQEPFLPYLRSESDSDDIVRERTWFEIHLGTDAQRSAWIFLVVSLVVFFEQIYNLYNAEKYFLSSTLYVLGTFFGVWGCLIFVRASYPSQIVTSCFYSNESIEPPPGSWCCRIHCGTRVLRGGQLQLFGAILFALASAVWIQEDHLYSEIDKHAGSSNVAEYIELVFGNFLLVSGCVYQLLGQYPQSVLKRDQTSDQPTRSSWLGTDLQVAGWFLEVFSVLWLLRSSIRFDQSTTPDEERPPRREDEEPPSVPFSEYDWISFADCWLSLLMALGSYFVLAQAYREGTRMDAVLIQQAREASKAALTAQLEEAIEGPQLIAVVKTDDRVLSVPQPPRSTTPAVPRVVKPVAHPLQGIRDLCDSKTVLRRARKILNDESIWKSMPAKDTKVWVHTAAHAVKFESSRFKEIDPLLLAAVLQSETFKSYQLRAPGGSSVSIAGKLAGVNSGGAVVFEEKIPPNPPMPAHESTFASFFHESSRSDTNEDIAEVVEWAVNETVPTRTSGPAAAALFTDNKTVRVNPFRYMSVSQDGTVRGMMWLEDIARWMPEFLLRTEMSKVPLMMDDLAAFVSAGKCVDTVISRNLNMWLWQKIHNGICPLAAAVLVRSSPAYRVLLSKYPGLRTRVPEPVSIPVGALVHPLEHFPITLNSDADIDVAIAVKHGADFITNEFGAWQASESDSRQKPGRARVTVWRQELEGESIKPFRIQARIHGVDPMTLALLIHRNKLNELMDAYQAAPSNPRASVMSSIDPMRSRQSATSSPERVVPDTSVLGSMMGDEHVTVSNSLIATFQHGAVRVYRERKRRTKFMPGSREREFTFASVMKDISPLKAVVVHFGIKSVLAGDPLASAEDSSVVKLRRFHAWSLENDGGSDTKFTWCGLVPVGGRTEKLSAWVSSGSELKEKAKFVERLANMFVSDARAREAIHECHQFIAYSTVRSAMGRELKRLSINYLARTSPDYKSLLSEVQPPMVGGIVGFDQDLPHMIDMKKREAKRRKQKPRIESDQESDSSEVTVPLSPVESHRKDSQDDEDETRTLKHGDLIDSEDVIPPQK